MLPEAAFSKLSYLIVDDSSTMRASLRITVTTMGGTNIDVATNPNEVLYRIRTMNRRYDVILCDYNLNADRDGQQLLEELRARELVSLRTIFIMVTAENTYQKVVSAVELAPDDYLIKPFSGEVLKDRLTRQIYKKHLLRGVYDALEAHEPDKALARCDKLLRGENPFRVELMRHKAEICATQEWHDRAREHYAEILTVREFPWAHFGVARLEYAIRNLPAAREMLEKVVTEAPRFVSAKDLLARVYSEQGEYEAARDVLMAANEQSGKNVLRQRELANAALATQDFELAHQSFNQALESGRGSVHQRAEDFVNFSIVAAAMNRRDEAAQALRAAEQQFKSKAQAVIALGRTAVEGIDAAQRGDQEAAREHLGKLDGLARSVGGECAKLGLATGIEAAAKAGDTELASNLAHTAIGLSHNDPHSLSTIEATLTRVGLSDVADRVEAIAEQKLTEANNHAVTLARDGDLHGAMEILRTAAANPAASVITVLNAAQAILVCIERDGWQPDNAREALRLLRQAEHKSPGHPKLKSLEAFYATLVSRYEGAPPVNTDEAMADASGD